MFPPGGGGGGGSEGGGTVLLCEGAGGGNTGGEAGLPGGGGVEVHLADQREVETEEAEAVIKSFISPSAGKRYQSCNPAPWVSVGIG